MQLMYVFLPMKEQCYDHSSGGLLDADPGGEGLACALNTVILRGTALV